MKKKVVLTVMICGYTLLFALLGFLLFATSYKKTYTFDKTYKLQITRDTLTQKEMESIANRQDRFFNKGYDTATFSGKEVDVLILVYSSESTHANVVQTLKCDKMVWKKTPYKIENNLHFRMYKIRVKFNF